MTDLKLKVINDDYSDIDYFKLSGENMKGLVVTDIPECKCDIKSCKCDFIGNKNIMESMGNCWWHKCRKAPPEGAKFQGYHDFNCACDEKLSQHCHSVPEYFCSNKCKRKWLKSKYNTIYSAIGKKEIKNPFFDSIICYGCGNKESDVIFKKCSRCLKVAYCSKECQIGHWKTHKSVCIKDNA